MANIVDDLIDVLWVKEIEKNVFLGKVQDLGLKHLFGGHVLAQALVAAAQTVEKDRFCHSLHGYFLRPGKNDEPIYYEVDLIRSGKSFTTRRVVAKQGGLAIFSMSASFHSLEPGFHHQTEKPSVPGPEGIMTELEQARKAKDMIAEQVRDKLTADRPIEIRIVDPVDPFHPHKRPPLKYSWFRTLYPMTCKDQIIHQAMLAYASDFGLATTALLPHGVTFFQPGTQVASLDHAMWFHRPFYLDGWMLYVKDSPSAAGSRGFNRGSIYTQDGVMVASVAQESLIRRQDHPKEGDPTKGLVS